MKTNTSTLLALIKTISNPALENLIINNLNSFLNGEITTTRVDFLLELGVIEYKDNKSKGTKMGTIEPIYSTKDSEDFQKKLAFIRGVITKYENTEVDREDIINYIKNQVL